MSALITEWINKGEGDRLTAKRESEVIELISSHLRQ
jgi:hypothetical protein